MTKAPSIKEALEAVEPYLDAITCYASTINEHEGNRVARLVRSALATLSPTAGESREAIADQWAQAYRAFIGAFDTPIVRRKVDDEYSKDARKRLSDFNDAIIASGLVQDEAAIRKDEREKCAEIADCHADMADATAIASSGELEVAIYRAAESASKNIAAAIRSRDGGAES